MCIRDSLKDREGRIKLLKSIIEVLTNNYPVKDDIEFIINITNDPCIIEAIREAYREYRYRKTGVRIEELEKLIPEKKRVFIEKELIKFKQVIIDVYEYGKGIKRIGVFYPVDYYNFARADKVLVLKQFGIDVADPDNVKIIPMFIPWVFFYKADDMVIISYEPLRQGDNEITPSPITIDYIDRILEKLPINDKKKLLKALKKVLVRVSEEGKVVGEIREIQKEGENVQEAKTGERCAISMDGVVIGKDIKGNDVLNNFISPGDLEKLEKIKVKLTQEEKDILSEMEAG